MQDSTACFHLFRFLSEHFPRFRENKILVPLSMMEVLNQSTVSAESRAFGYRLQWDVFNQRLLVWFFAGTGKTLLEQEKKCKGH